MTRVLRRLGLPDVGPHRRFVSAVGIDALGSGVWLPLSVLYFVRTTDLSLHRVGLGLSVAAVLALPAALLAGSLVDRLGARRTLQAGNLLQVLGFTAYVGVHDVVALAAVATVTGVGRCLFHGAFGPMVAAVSDPGERERWFGLLTALRNTGFAVGGLVAAAAVTIGGPLALHVVVLLNATSYLLSFLLMTGVRTRPVQPVRGATAPTAPEPGRWRDVLSAPGYPWLVGANLGYALSAMALNVAVPVYVVDRLGLPGWVTGAVYVLNTVLVGLGQGLVVRAMTGLVRWRALALSGTLSAVAFVGLFLAADVGPTAAAVVVVLAAMVVFTLGETTGGPVLATLAAEAPPPDLRGRYQAAVQLTWNAAAALAPVLYLSLLAAGRWQVWGVLVLIALLGAGCCVPLGRRLPLAARPIADRPPGAVGATS